MDFNDLKNTVSNLTLYDIKAGFRKAQNAVMNYTEMEAKVREATNNEPWGASSTTMQEIASATFNYQSLNEIMPMLYRRFTEKSAEEWRQIYKALQLLEFLIKHGSERVVDDARGHITLLKMMRQFHFIDQNGKDQGINVRNRAKELTELLGDVERIRAERKKARATKSKYTGVEGGTSFGGGFSGSSRYGGFGPESSGGGAQGSYGGYSGGVYGDGGGFGGESSEYQEGGSRSDRFEEYDEFDEADRPAASSTRRTRTERPGTKKTTSEAAKPKEPEVDLFSFDEPAATTSAPAAMGGSGLAALAGPSSAPTAANDDDEFDDFQSADVPAAQPLAAPAAFSQPLTAQPAAAASQAFAALSPSASTSSGTQGVNYSAFASPAQAARPAAPAAFQQSAPNYFGGVPSGGSQVSAPTTTTNPGPTTMANTRPVQSGSKPAAPAAGGGDAFGALWGKASAGIRKTSAASSGPALGQLAKEKSSASIWGSNASGSQTLGGSGAGSGGGSASGDLLG